MKPIILTNEEHENIIKKAKFIGSGVDGSIYKISNNTVFKFYHKDNNYVSLSNVKYDNEGVIINNFKDLRSLNYNNCINEKIFYTDEDGVILTREDAIFKAMEKQENVKLTKLPSNIIYLNNKIIGCEYVYYPHKLGIYSSAYLPLKKRLVIAKRVIEKVKELLHNNIYPVTLAQRDDRFPFLSNGSNVLIGIDLEPYIIDLDGISALYSESFSNKYYAKVLTSLSTLILEILSRVELSDNIEDDDNVIDELIDRMFLNGIPKISSQKYFDNNRLDLGELNYIIKTLERK